MRFKSTVDHVSLLTALLQSAEKMGKRAILKLTDETVFLICAKGEGDVQMWSNVPAVSTNNGEFQQGPHCVQDNIFSEYRIESNSSKNTIALEFTITPLVQALRSATSKSGDNRDAAEVTLKLVKKGEEAALSLDVKTQTRDGKKVNVVHEVHVLVQKPSEIDEMSQPKCPPLETHIELPSAEQCRPVVDHLRQISDIIWLGATRDGRFRLCVNNDSTEIETMWSNLRNTTIGGPSAFSDHGSTADKDAVHEKGEDADEGGEETDDSTWHMVPLDARILQKWFSSQVLQNNVIAGIAPKYCVVAYIYVGDRQHGGIITYFLPSRNVDVD